jgi:GTP-binding protein
MFHEAIYIKSIDDLKDAPEAKPQFLLLGRSNVGKSSFINTLTNRKNLARVSNSPGKTVYLNYYLIDQAFYLVDAPGYGYARRSKSQKDDFIIMIENYLLNQTDLVSIYQLIDFKVGPTMQDIETYEFLKSLNKHVIVIATKKDKIPKTKQFKQEKLILEALGNPKNFFSYSSVTKENLDQIKTSFQI